MPNKDGVSLGGKTIRGFNENAMQGYPLRLPLTTRQVTDVVMYDEDILCVKGGRQVPDDHEISGQVLKDTQSGTPTRPSSQEESLWSSWTPFERRERQD